MVLVEIYSKADCHLCEEAKQVLETVRATVPFELRVLDIESDPELFALYKERIPVVFIEKELAYQFRVPERDLRERLARARRPG
jgi:glutaredoxin